MSVMACHGRGAGHCCHIGGGVCPFLEENTINGRRWACGLYRRQRGLNPEAPHEIIWEYVYLDADYAIVRNLLNRSGYPPNLGCGDFPEQTPDSWGSCCYGSDEWAQIR